MWDYAPIIIVWVAGVLRELGNLFSREELPLQMSRFSFRVKRNQQAWAIVLLATAFAAVGLWNIHGLREGKALVPFDRMVQITEASGGAALDSRAFVVGDERSQGLVEFTWSQNQYNYPRSCTIDKGGIAVQPNDLEAVAVGSTASRLLLLTSHSNNNEGKKGADRRMLVEVAVAPRDIATNCKVAVTRGPVDLRPAILQALSARPEFGDFSRLNTCEEGVKATGDNHCGYQNEEGFYEVFQAEGLAIAGNVAYIGLRAPLIKEQNTERAIVLQATTDLFSEDLTFKVLPIPVLYHGEYYGISSLDVDPRNPDRLVILGNSPTNAKILTPIVCRWLPASSSEPECNPLPRFAEPAPWARPESLLFGPDDSVVVFLDGENRAYGQAIYSRRELGL